MLTLYLFFTFDFSVILISLIFSYLVAMLCSGYHYCTSLIQQNLNLGSVHVQSVNHCAKIIYCHYVFL